jgi:uncharacterized protein YdgA (DUF945 family)
MKKVIGSAVALSALAVAAATWWSGKQVQDRLAEQYKTIEGLPFVKVTQRAFERGFRRSTDVVTFELAGDLMRGMEAAEHESGRSPHADAKPPKPLLIKVRSEIDHGPFAGGTIAAAVAHSELVIDDEPARKDLEKLFGDKKPLTVRTVFGFDGGGRSHAQSPAFTHSLAGARAGGTVTWGGVTADVTFTRDMQSVNLKGSMPKLEIVDPKGVHMLVSDVRITADQKRVFADEPFLYAGTQRFEISRIEMRSVVPHGSAPADAVVGNVPSAPMVLKDMSYVVDIPFDGGEYLDVVARMSAASMLIDAREYGPVHYNVAMKHLHARTAASLYRAALNMYGDSAALQREPGAALAPLTESAKTLLGHNPEFAIDRISFTSPHGQAQIAARVKLVDAKPEDLEQPVSLLGKLDASAELKLPAALLAELGHAKEQSAQEQQAHRQAFAARIDALVTEGYVARVEGMLESKLVYRNGALSINGKPFDPRALAGAAAETTGEEDKPPRARQTQPRGRGSKR